MSKSKLKKISAYVPERVFQEIIKYSNKKNISISQSIIAGLVAGFDIPETEIEGRGRKIVISSDQETKEKVLKLEHDLKEFSSSITSQVELILSVVQNKKQTASKDKVDQKRNIESNGMVKNQSTDKILDNSVAKVSTAIEPYENKQLALTELDIDFEPFTGKLLALRFGTHKDYPSRQKNKSKSIEEFKTWSTMKDPDRITWIPNPDGTGYLPSEELTEDQLLKLQRWIAANS